ncbi:MAG: transposase [Phycisphaerae bacterium]|nr:transposase [Phycisphaerae bacterium]
MQKVLGYMLTWTACGNWLQGDRRGYVKDGQILESNPSLENKNKENMRYPKVSLNTAQREIIKKAIYEESAKLNQNICAIAVRKNHTHLVAECSFISAGSAVSHYKNAARLAMRSSGFAGRLWTRGFSVRYCFDENHLNATIRYVNNHNKNIQSESPQLYVGG